MLDSNDAGYRSLKLQGSQMLPNLTREGPNKLTRLDADDDGKDNDDDDDDDDDDGRSIQREPSSERWGLEIMFTIGVKQDSCTYLIFG